MGKFLAGLGVGAVVTAIAAGITMCEQERAHQAELAALDAMMNIQTELFKQAIKDDKETAK